jgi:CSLREA domain-containing protein
MSARQRRKRRQRRTEAARRTAGRPKRVLAGAGLTLGLGLGLGSSAQAAVQTTTVNSLTDPGDGTCDVTECTLREAITQSNNNGNSGDQDVIVFDSSLSGSILLSATLPTIKQSLWIQGPGTDPGDSPISIDGDASYRDILAVSGGNYAMDLKVSGLTVTNGAANGGGAGISVYWDYNDGDTTFPQPTLTVQDSEVSGNTGNDGAGIHGTRASMTIENSAIDGNTAHGISSGAGGGGVYLFSGNDGTLTIDHSTISNNTANGDNGRGGGVHANGPATIESSTISGNHTTGDHGRSGGLELNGDSTIQNSTISGNHTEGDHAYAGGLFVGFSDLSIDSSTISGNYTESEYALGGGVYSAYNTGPTISNSTISGNGAYLRGGGIYAKGDDGPLTLANTIVAGNYVARYGPDLYTSDETVQTSFSLIQDTSYADINEAVAGSNITGVDPQLGPLQDNGGPTFTEALPSTSPAVDAGKSAGSADQRELLRPVNFAGVASTAAGANCADIGAFELQLGGGGPGLVCHPSPPPPSGTNPTPLPTPTTPTTPHKKKCKKKKHKRSAESAKKKCKKKKKK